MNLPNGAEQVIAARKRGLKPAEMLIVSLVGRTDELNHTIYANERAEYDWRWLRGLKVCLYVNQKSNWRPVIEAMARQKPEWLGLYDVDQFKGATVFYLPRVEDIEKPKESWRWFLDFLPWTAWQNKEYAFGE